MSENPLLRQFMAMQAPPARAEVPMQPAARPEVPAGYRKVSKEELAAILARQQQPTANVDVAALTGQLFSPSDTEKVAEEPTTAEAAPTEQNITRTTEPLSYRRAALPVLGVVAISAMFLAGRSDAFAGFGSSEDISALTLDIFDDFEDCNNVATSAVISSQADVIWGMQLSDGRPGLMEAPVVTNGAANRNLQASLEGVKVDFAMCQNLGADNPVSIEDGHAVVDLSQVALVPSFEQGEAQGVETITVNPPAEGVEALYSAEEATRLTEANKNPANHRVIMNILRRDSLDLITTDETCGLPMQSQAKAAIVESLRDQASAQGVDGLEVRFQGTFLDFDKAYETGRNIEADFTSPVLMANDEATADDDLPVFAVENVIINQCEPAAVDQEEQS